jgi:hypothetical protein
LFAPTITIIILIFDLPAAQDVYAQWQETTTTTSSHD